jgi:hypothetical protein
MLAAAERFASGIYVYHAESHMFLCLLTEEIGE